MGSKCDDPSVEKQQGSTSKEKEEIWGWDGEHSPRCPSTGVHDVGAATVGRGRRKWNHGPSLAVPRAGRRRPYGQRRGGERGRRWPSWVMRHLLRTKCDSHPVGLWTHNHVRKVHKGTLPLGALEWGEGDVSTVQKESVGHQAGLSCQSGHGAHLDTGSWGIGSEVQTQGE